MRRLPFAIRRRLEKVAFAIGVGGGHRDYTRFILLGEGRSGSNFLRGLLNSHPAIVTFGELFRFHDSIGWEFPEYERHQQTPKLVALSQREPARFLETEVFGLYPRKIRAVGFKIFYYHAQNEERQPGWTYLQQRRDIAVVHVKRWNTLRSFLSLKKAFQTDRWTNHRGPEEDGLSIALDYQECLDRFVWAKEVKAEYDDRFRDHPMIEVVYETLCRNLQPQCQRILDFLGVPEAPLRSSTFKQGTLPLPKAITNYYELRKRFQGTPWEPFFED